jgi:glycosyltransferase involved in cell wall biosynthesis
MALLEAMSYGLAIVATAVGGVPDVVGDGEQALVVAPGDAAALAAALARLGADAELRARLGAAARERAADFSPDAVAAKIGAVYRGLL